MVRITQGYDPSACTYYTAFSPAAFRESNYNLICTVDEAHKNV